jgi:hypothetical protein
MPTPVILLVGGTNAYSKATFYEMFTGGTTNNKINIRTTVNTVPTIVLIDTPSQFEDRDLSEYCWEGVFHIADIIVNFGDWSPREVYGIRPNNAETPLFITWSGDHHETMKRIMDIVQRG